MADPSKKKVYSDTAPTGIAYDTHSQAPEVYESSNLPEVVPGQQAGYQAYQDPNQQYHYQQQQYPPQYNEGWQNDYPQSVNPASAAGWTAASQQGVEAPTTEKTNAKKTILGLPKKRFWLIIGPLLAILVIGLAVGLGVGLSQSKSSTSSSSPYPAAPTPVTCPAANGTLYTQSAADGGAKFLIVCNIDYNSNDPSNADLTSANATSAEQCMQFCGQNNQCAGAWFGDYFGHKCFLKSKLGKSASSGTSIFVIKQTS